MTWTQNYDPAGHWLLSTLLAAVPVLILLSALAIFRIKAHFAALIGLAASLTIACSIFGMPLKMGAMSAVYGILYGLFPIGWIVLNVIFMYDLTCEAGHFKVLQQSLMGITQDRRLQLVLIAFAFGAFFEGASGFVTPVAVTGAILIGLGFSPLAASGLSLIANTAPVAYGALGTPIIALAAAARLPAIYPEREYADDGGLIAHGPNIPDSFYRAAGYVDRILHGAKPADLPIDEPAKFDFIVNLRTARALGFAISPDFLSGANEVIE